MRARGFVPPVLVGGGAVERYTLSAVSTGDFDIVTARQEEFEQEVQRLGFTKPGAPGHTPLGWLHPELMLGFEVVSSLLLDGAADRDRVVLVDLGADGRAAIILIENMIADRMGQFASGAAPAMLDQAKKLFGLHADVDLDYMDARIRHESAGEYGIEDLRD